MSAGTILRSARAAANISQRALARRANASQPAIAAIESGQHDTKVATLENFLAAAHCTLTAFPAPATSPTVAATAELIRESVTVGNHDRAIRCLIALSDGLGVVDPATRVALCIAPPPPTGSLGWDAALAGLVRHQLPAGSTPSWVNDLQRTSEHPWYIDTYEAAQKYARERTPPAFSRHNVYLAASELDSA